MIERRPQTTDTGKSSAYARVRAFLESEDTSERRVTVEWLAGRLHLPIADCAEVVERLVGESALRRHRGGPSEGSWFEILSPPPAAGVRHAVLGTLTICVSIAIVVLGAMLHHIFFFALGLGLGLLIAFAWLDWELKSRA